MSVGIETHTCAALGCGLEVPRNMLMCRRHWFMVPKDRGMGPDYRVAVQMAIDAVAKRERTP